MWRNGMGESGTAAFGIETVRRGGSNRREERPGAQLVNYDSVVTTHSPACAADGGDFTTEAMRLCGWSFATTSRDGGGQ
jgi:hypothetical protein